jgi:hypothetical protein
MQFSFTTTLSLAPGFSPVWDRCERNSRFNGFFAMLEAAEAADVARDHRVTRLKPGANEKKSRADDFANSP